MLTDSRAANMAEYAIIAVIVILVAVAAFGRFGDKIVSALDSINFSR
jgi:Flp pilus assembly pilin Flp